MYTFMDGREMHEVYDTEERVLKSRRWKLDYIQPPFGTHYNKNLIIPWMVEIGPESEWEVFHVPNKNISESSQNPFFYRVDSKEYFIWHVKNVPFHSDVFNVNCEDDFIVVSTLNKMFYKKFRIPDMDRQGFSLSQDSISFFHCNGVLTITYRKPNEIIDQEQSRLAEIEEHATYMAENVAVKSQEVGAQSEIFD